MKYTKEINRREFKNSVSKKAYLECCKWLAKNVYSSPSYSQNIVVKIQKMEKDGDLFVFRVILYYQMDFDSAKEMFCNNCKQMHETFYSDRPHCSECKLKVFVKKMEFEINGVVESLSREFGGENIE